MSKDKKTKTSIVGWEGLICSLAIVIVSALWISNIYIPSVNGAEKTEYKSYEVTYVDENANHRGYMRIKARAEYDLKYDVVNYYLEYGGVIKVTDGSGIYVHSDEDIVEYLGLCSVLKARWLYGKL